MSMASSSSSNTILRASHSTNGKPQLLRGVVFDLDGTLLDQESAISDYTSETLKLLAEKEIAYTVATGRALHSARAILEGHQFLLPQAYKNGVMIWHPEQSRLSSGALLTGQTRILSSFGSIMSHSWGFRGRTLYVFFSVRGHTRNQQLRVNAPIPPAHPPVQVRPGGAAGGTNLANQLPGLYLIAHFHMQLAQVQEAGRKSITVIQNDRTT